jgi:hydroxymethylbilane synthase
MQTDTVRIGTRGSPLALAQAQEVRDRLAAAHGIDPNAFEIIVILTSGDRILDRPLAEIGGKGLFTKEIENALLHSVIDLAVHSSKDMATDLPDGLELAVFLEREDPRDAFLSPNFPDLLSLPEGAKVGTSSLRRQALVRRARPDLNVIGFRGNVQTRLQKLEKGVADATLLALAGLRRLNMETAAVATLPLDVFPPAPGQGAICIECRSGDIRTKTLLEAIHHRPTGSALACERAFLAALDGSCRTPIAGHAAIDAGQLHFSGMILTPDGSEAHTIEGSGNISEAERIGRKAGEAIRAEAGTGFFESWS